MKNKTQYTFRDHLKESLEDPDFQKAWAESEPEYVLATQLIEKRLQKNMSQRDLAKKLHTTQAVISRIETMKANPSLTLLKRIAKILDVKVIVQFQSL